MGDHVGGRGSSPFLWTVYEGKLKFLYAETYERDVQVNVHRDKFL
jgi:hypothetical protein